MKKQQEMIGDLVLVSERQDIEGIAYNMYFKYDDKTSCALSFPCDEKGNLYPFRCPEAEENYRLALTGNVRGHRVLPGRLDSYEFRNVIYATGKCVCGEKVYLANFTNTCECGRDYNSSGQELAPRSQWGEETGEHWSECY